MRTRNIRSMARKLDFRLLQVMSRVPGVTVTPHHGRIEEKPLDFYEQFHAIILGLDSLEARRYMNSVACSLLGKLLFTLHEFSSWSLSWAAASWGLRW